MKVMEMTGTKQAAKTGIAIIVAQPGITEGKVVSQRKLIQLAADELSLIFPSPGNRLGGSLSKTNRAHIDVLKQSMRDQGFLARYPIVVHSDGEIISGHHRYEAALELKIPVWIEINDSAAVAEYAMTDGMTKKWSTMDWIMKWASEGKGDYPKVLDFYQKTNVKLKVGLMLLLGVSSPTCKGAIDTVARGQMKVVNLDQAWKRMLSIEQVSMAAFPKHPNTGRNDQIFVSALLHCMNDVAGFDTCTMASRAARQTERIRLQRTRKETAKMLEDVYNYGVPVSKHLKFC